MSDVFISYKREDGPRVAPIAEGLRQMGLSVWMDDQIPGGASWRQKIHERLEAARCVIVVWSELSVGPAGGFVHDEAARASGRGILLPVRIDAVSPPIGFGEIQALDLVGWRGKTRDPRFRDVVAAAKAMAAGEPRPRPKAPGRRKRFAAGAVGGVVLAVIVGFAGDVAGLQGALCRLPGVRAACGAAGLGGVPSRDEKELWASRQAGDCEALRNYLARFADGAYAAEAHRRLQAAIAETRERWTAEKRRLALTVRQGLDPLGDETAARQNALERGEEEARFVCDSFKTGEFRLLSAAADPQRWRCEARGSGVVCGFDGQAVCGVEVRRVDRIEVCP